MTENAPLDPRFVGRKPTIDELEKIINSEEGSDITINPDGSIGVFTEEMKAAAERDRINFAFSQLSRLSEENKRLKAALRAMTE